MTDMKLLCITGATEVATLQQGWSLGIKNRYKGMIEALLISGINESMVSETEGNGVSGLGHPHSAADAWPGEKSMQRKLIGSVDRLAWGCGGSRVIPGGYVIITHTTHNRATHSSYLVL